MSHQQFHSELQQWEELESEGRAEAEWREREDAELSRQESERREEDDFCAALEQQFPILKAWPGKDRK